MKLNFSLKNKEASLEADVEKLIEKNMDNKTNSPAKKTRYQIKQEEKRKNAELKHKQQMQYFYMLIGMMAFFFIIAIVGAILGI